MTPAAASQSKSLVPFPLDANSASVNIPLSKIIRSETNRKAEVDEAFVESIRQNGVISPVTLRKIIASDEDVAAALDGKRAIDAPYVAGETIYKLVAGERRWLGAKKAGRASIPAIIRELTDTQAIEIQADENEQREDLSPMDRCNLYCQIRDQYMKDHAGERGYSETKCIHDVAANRKVEVRAVYNVISLGKLHDYLQVALRQNEMKASHGYEIAGLEEDQQLEVLRWIRKETLHSQGDIPSVRRLKREIISMQTAWDEQKRQAALPLKAEGEAAEVQTPAAAAPPTPNKKQVEFYEKDGSQDPIRAPKPLSAAAIKKHEAAVAKEIAANLKAQRDATRNRAIAKKYKLAFFTALASKVHISSRMLTHVVPNLIFEIWDVNDLPVDGFAQKLLGWPAPKQGDRYTYEEISGHAKKHTRKFTPKLLAALVITLNMQPKEAEQLGKYYGVNPKQLLKKATAAVNEEARLEKIPKVPSSQREKQLHYVLDGGHARWTKLRKAGASDPELRKLLGEIWTSEPGFHGKEIGSVQCKGGADPSVVFEFKTKEPLKGAALLKEVRDLLKIPQKGAA